MTIRVKFYWWQSYKIWNVKGYSISDISKKADALCQKYHAIHFELLDNERR